MSKLTVAAIQHASSSEQPLTLERNLAAIAEAAANGAQLVVLPELHQHRYFCSTHNTAYFELAEHIPGPTTQALSAAAARHGVVIVGSVFEQRGVGVYHNTAVVFDNNGDLAGYYRKMHIPEDPGYHEKFYFYPGRFGVSADQNLLWCVGRHGLLGSVVSRSRAFNGVKWR